jgi:hypothetical protein
MVSLDKFMLSEVEALGTSWLTMTQLCQTSHFVLSGLYAISDEYYDDL